MNRLHIFRRGAAVAAAACLVVAAGAQAQTATCPAQTDAIDTSRWTLSADGSEVTDKTTGLVWARCSVGQVWNGSAQQCATSATDATAKTPDVKTHEQALTLAKATTGWRLPTVKELASLVNDACSTAPRLDKNVFKNTPSVNGQTGPADDRRYWASTPSAGSSGIAWYVNFGNGMVDGYYGGGTRGSTYAVRLVRASQ